MGSIELGHKLREPGTRNPVESIDLIHVASGVVLADVQESVRGKASTF